MFSSEALYDFYCKVVLATFNVRQTMYRQDDFNMESIQISDTTKAAKIVFTKHEKGELCYYRCAFYTHDFNKLAYYCVEYREELPANQARIVEITPDEKRVTLGYCELDDSQGLIQCAEYFAAK